MKDVRKADMFYSYYVLGNYNFAYTHSRNGRLFVRMMVDGGFMFKSMPDTDSNLDAVTATLELIGFEEISFHDQWFKLEEKDRKNIEKVHKAVEDNIIKRKEAQMKAMVEAEKDSKEKPEPKIELAKP